MRATLNMVAATLDYVARLAVGFASQPILVSRLGDLIYGLYQTLGQLVGLATPAGGRSSQALKWTVARRQPSDDYREKRLQVGSAIAVSVAFIPVLVVLGGVTAWVAPDLLHLPERLHVTVRVATALLVVELIVGNLATIPKSVLEGENLGYKRMGLSAVVVVAGGVLTVIAAVLGTGLIGVTAMFTLTSAMTGVVFLRVARRFVPWFGAARPTMAQVRAFFRLSGWFLAWNLVMQLVRSCDSVVLGMATSVRHVTVYSLTRYVPEAIFSLVAIMVGAIMPGLGGLVGAGDMRRANQVRSQAMAVTWLLATASGAAFLVVHRSFLGLWVGEQYYPGRVAGLLVVLMMLQFALIRNDANIIDLTLELRSKVLLGLVAGGVAIGLSVIVMRTWTSGITGLAIGFLAGRGIMSLTYPWLVARALGTPVLNQAMGVLRPAGVSAAVFACAYAAAPRVDIGSWISLAMATGALVLGFGAGSFFVGLSQRQRRRLIDCARRLVPLA